MSRASFIGRLLCDFYMAGFEVATHGRFWVATEGEGSRVLFESGNIFMVDHNVSEGEDLPIVHQPPLYSPVWGSLFVTVSSFMSDDPNVVTHRTKCSHWCAAAPHVTHGFEIPVEIEGKNLS